MPRPAGWVGSAGGHLRPGPADPASSVHRRHADVPALRPGTGHDERGLRLWLPHGGPMALTRTPDGRGLRDMPFVNGFRTSAAGRGGLVGPEHHDAAAAGRGPLGVVVLGLPRSARRLVPEPGGARRSPGTTARRPGSTTPTRISTPGSSRTGAGSGRTSTSWPSGWPTRSTTGSATRPRSGPRVDGCWPRRRRTSSRSTEPGWTSGPTRLGRAGRTCRLGWDRPRAR